MKICLAQIKSVKGDVDKNIVRHIEFIDLTVSYQADIIVFPELSLTGYEPELANKLAVSIKDPRFNDFQEWSDLHQISICVGMPIKTTAGITISMLVFQSLTAKQIYSKQHLHEDEECYFVKGDRQLYLTIDKLKITPAICYEALLGPHLDNAVDNETNVYMASVAKSKEGVEKSNKHFAQISKRHGMIVIMANSVGYCDNFIAYGSSAVWNNEGQLLGQLDNKKEGILILDTKTQEVVKAEINIG